MKSVGVVGNGFVGNAVYENFKGRILTTVYDVIPEKAINSYEEVISSDVVFVCLPTPMNGDGSCKVSYVEDFFNKVPKSTPGLFVIKSTVPIGTTDKLCSIRDDLRIIHNPEFLTAENAKDDFLYCNRNVVGGNRKDAEDFAAFLLNTFDTWKTIPMYVVSSKESETIKYFANSFLAVKIAYFNNLYQTCKSLEIDYNLVKDAITEDYRIGYYHTKVPGPDGQLGFGGYCFPKDINALIHTLEDIGVDNQLLLAAWNYNKTLRDDL